MKGPVLSQYVIARGLQFQQEAENKVKRTPGYIASPCIGGLFPTWEQSRSLLAARL